MSTKQTEFELKKGYKSILEKTVDKMLIAYTSINIIMVTYIWSRDPDTINKIIDYIITFGGNK